MGWKCKECGEATDSDDLTFPIMHETEHAGHECEPNVTTTMRWARAFGLTKS